MINVRILVTVNEDTKFEKKLSLDPQDIRAMRVHNAVGAQLLISKAFEKIEKEVANHIGALITKASKGANHV